MSSNLLAVLSFKVVSLITFSLLTLISDLSDVRVIEKTDLYSGSSQQGKAILAEVGSNWVVAIQCCLLFSSTNLLL